MTSPGQSVGSQFKSGTPRPLPGIHHLQQPFHLHHGYFNPEIQPLVRMVFPCRSREMNDATKTKSGQALAGQYGGGKAVVIQDFNQVTASVGAQVPALPPCGGDGLRGI